MVKPACNIATCQPCRPDTRRRHSTCRLPTARCRHLSPLLRQQDDKVHAAGSTTEGDIGPVAFPTGRRHASCTNFLCKRCVDTPINGVDTSTQTQREIVQKCQECVDTCQECVDTSGSFPEIKGTQVDTLPGQVDTRPSSQNSQFEELGQQKPLKHLKEVDQVEAIVGEEFKEGPTSQIAEHRLGLHVYKLLPNSSFYKGVHLKNEIYGRTVRTAATALSRRLDGTNTLAPPARSGNNPYPAGSALLPGGRTALLETARSDASAAASDAYLHECTTSSTSRSGQHRLFPKRKKKTHSPDCLRGAGTEKISLNLHSAAAETDTPAPGP
ncbi:hypothetical protein Taro_040746 [Colocasia esculenta]|uniref:Uncharacterized protein n=1 Tax=Colocasia esculenta TaxID=4460 RepID=A0A843WJT1_COLES|nr:hypothetical protein [Colocasia esculenta]